MADNALKITVDVVNSEKVKELTAKIAEQKAQIAEWNEMMKQGILTQTQFNAVAGISATQIEGFQRELSEIPTAATSAGRGLSQLAYAVDDMQYGFNAVVNNIPQIVMGLGGGAGLAGALGIAAVAANQFIKHWDEITSALQENWSGGSAEQMKELTKRTEEAAKAFVKLLEAKTHFEEKSEAATNKTITDAGADKLFKGLVETLGVSGRGAQMTAQEEHNIAITPAAQNAKIKRDVQRRITAENEATAQRLMDNANEKGQKGINAKLTIQSLIKENPGAFPKEMEQRFNEDTPEAMKRQEQFEKQLEAKKKVEENIKKANEEHVAKMLKRGEGDKRIEDDKQRLLKEDAAEKKAWLQDINKIQHENRRNAKDKRIQDLEDKRDAVQEDMHNQLEANRRTRPGQIIGGGPKASLDLYQIAGGHHEKEERAHRIREASRRLLQSIDTELKKERRAVLN